MSVTKRQAQLLTRAYSAVRRSGFLKTRFGRQVFARSYFLYKRYLEDPFERLTRDHPQLFRGGDVLDVGANIGYTATVFARAIDADRRVYAFEPELSNFHLLQDAAAHARAMGRIVPLQYAIGAEDGFVDLCLNESHHADHRVLTDEYRSRVPARQIMCVPLTAIDTFWRSRESPLCFIKIDVQGYELAVCQGMRLTVSAHPGATIALEYMPDAIRELGFDPQCLLSWFAEQGYLPHSLQHNGTITAGMPSDLGRGGYTDLLFSRRPLA